MHASERLFILYKELNAGSAFTAAGHTASPTLFSVDGYLDSVTFNANSAIPHKNVAQNDRRMCGATSEITENSILIPS